LTTDIKDPISEEERKRIRAEMRYALAVLEESKSSKKKSSIFQSILSYLSNGFVLLIVGSLITSLLVPKFQRSYEHKKQQLNLMQDCFAQYLLYSNSIWQEYYAIFPLLHHASIELPTYNQYLNEISKIKLARYDAYAHVRALAIVFRGTDEENRSRIEKELEDFAVRVNQISAAIDDWLRNLYCYPDKCNADPRAPVDSNFNPIFAFHDLQELLRKIQDDEHRVSELMVRQIKTIK
jgi:hypothetical protein